MYRTCHEYPLALELHGVRSWSHTLMSPRQDETYKPRSFESFKTYSATSRSDVRVPYESKIWPRDILLLGYCCMTYIISRGMHLNKQIGVQVYICKSIRINLVPNSLKDSWKTSLLSHFYPSPYKYLNHIFFLKLFIKKKKKSKTLILLIKIWGKMSGKGAKGLLMGKSSSSAATTNKDKKKSVTRSSRAGLQVHHLFIYLFINWYI